MSTSALVSTAPNNSNITTETNCAILIMRKTPFNASAESTKAENIETSNISKIATVISSYII